jgi:hypothetical protein
MNRFEYTSKGVAYSWDLCGPQGAAFVVYLNEEQTRQDYYNAVHELKNSRDVVCIRQAHTEDWDEIYRNAIFCHKDTKHLKYYQINDDRRLIRKCRLEKMSIDEYVKVHVLPMADILKERHCELK